MYALAAAFTGYSASQSRTDGLQSYYSDDELDMTAHAVYLFM